MAALALSDPAHASEPGPLNTPTATWTPDRPNRLRLPSTTPTSQRFRDVLAITEKFDPSRDEYPSEIRAEKLERELAEIATGLIDACPRGEGNRATDAQRYLGDGEPDFVRGAYRVWRGRDFVPRVALDACALWTMPGGSVADREGRDIRFILSPVGENRPGGAWARAYVTTSCHRGGTLMQRNQIWDLNWADVGPTSAAIFRDEVITAPGPTFVDITADVLGNDPALLDLLGRGAEYWTARIDRPLGIDILGHAGLCVGDVNGDGLDDVYVAQIGGLPNLLLVQNPDGSVTNRAKETGVDLLDMTRACLLADMDNDGDRDLVLSVRNATVIFANDGKGNFGGPEGKPVLSARTGTPSDFYSIAAADYDRNGFLDLYSVRYVKATYGVSIPIPYHDANNGPPNHLLANFGAWKFDDVTDKVGLNQNNSRFSLAASWEDFDNDGDPDLYVASDFGQANLYVNDGGRFHDEARERGAMNQAAGMGVTWSDFDGNGIVDLYVSNMYSAPGVRVVRAPQFRTTDTREQRQMFLGHVMGNSLFRGKGAGRFEDISSRIESRFVGWSWGSLFADINGDGWDDLLVPNGNLTGSREADIDGLFWRQVASESPLTVAAAPKYEDGWAAMSLLMNDGYSWSGHQRNVTYLNVGPTKPPDKVLRVELSSDFHRSFVDVSTLSGFGYFDDARAIALTDWDHDGDLDAWVRNRTAPMLRFLRNMTKENERDQPRSRFLSLVLVGADGNRQAIGARVEAFAGNHRLTRSVRAGEGYLSQSSDRMLLNIPKGDELSELAVRWPSGEWERFAIPALDEAYRLTEGRGPEAEPISPRTPTRLTDRAAPIPAASDVGVRRTLLVDRFALPPMELRTIDGRITNTESKIGKPCLWVFWSARSPRSMDALRQLSARIAELIQRDIEVIPISVDDSAVLPASAVAARAIDPNLPVITCPPELFDLVDVLQQEVHGSPQDLSLPTAWIVDRLGLIVSVQRDGIDLAAAMEDARRPTQPSTLFAGRVLFPMGRNFGVVAQQLRQRGATEFAEYYRELAERLRARPPQLSD